MRPQRVGPLLHVPEQSGRGIGQGGMVPPIGIGRCCRRRRRRRRYHRPTRQGHVGDAAPQRQELRPCHHDGVEGAVGQFHGELRRGDGPRAIAATGTGIGADRLGQCRHRRRARPGQLGGGKLGSRCCCRCGIVVGGSSSSWGVAARPIAAAAAAAAAAEGRPLGRLDGIEQCRRQLDQADRRGGPVGGRADGGTSSSSSSLGGGTGTRIGAADHDLDGGAEGGGAGTSSAVAAATVRGHDVGAQTLAAGAGRPLAVDPDGQLGIDTACGIVLPATVVLADRLVGEEAGNDGRSGDRHLGGGGGWWCLLLLLLRLLLLLDGWGDHRPTGTGTGGVGVRGQRSDSGNGHPRGRLHLEKNDDNP